MYNDNQNNRMIPPSQVKFISTKEYYAKEAAKDLKCEKLFGINRCGMLGITMVMIFIMFVINHVFNYPMYN